MFLSLRETCHRHFKQKHKRRALTNEMLLSTGDDVLNKVKFMDECFVPKTKFLSYAREKAWSNYHIEYLKHMQSVIEQGLLQMQHGFFSIYLSIYS